MPARARRPQRLVTSRRCFAALWSAQALALLVLCDACEEPPTFNTMKIKGSSKTSYDPGERVDYECRPGYKRTQSLPFQITCLDDGSWSALKESCAPKSCPTPAEPRNGEIINRTGSFLFGSKAHYRCFEGYKLLGKEVIYCDLIDDGVEWSDNPPLCEKINCLPPEKITNGKYSNSHKEIFEYSDVVTYSCNPSTTSDKFSLIGPSRRVCSANGTWSGTAPLCKVVVCPYPVVNNGTPKSVIPPKSDYNTRIMFECLPGFVLQGSDTVICDADSKWKPELPTCITGPTSPVTTSPPASSDPSSKPPVTTSTPEIVLTSCHDITSRDPSDARPSDTPPESPGSLDAWIIVVIILITAVVVILVGIFGYKHWNKTKR